jgi:hypothetical protein
MAGANAALNPSLPGIAVSKDGVASLAYAPAIHHLRKMVDARVKPAHDDWSSASASENKIERLS